MKKTKLHFLAAIMVVSMLSSTSVFAEGSLDDGVEPPPSEPISQIVPLLALLGVAFAYKSFKKVN